MKLYKFNILVGGPHGKQDETYGGFSDLREAHIQLATMLERRYPGQWVHGDYDIDDEPQETYFERFMTHIQNCNLDDLFWQYHWRVQPTGITNPYAPGSVHEVTTRESVKRSELLDILYRVRGIESVLAMEPYTEQELNEARPHIAALQSLVQQAVDKLLALDEAEILEQNMRTVKRG